ncbi:MAG: hypothetical protein KGN76_01435 [Acidobacteriota bacterium]|nr:hypothetical protein [Acidobacteriota bacterium]
MRPATAIALAAAVFASATLGSALAQQQGFMQKFDDPAIQYYKGPHTDAVAKLMQGMADGTVTLTYEPSNGYLLSLLKALDVPLQSQLTVFSQTSFQASLINEKNPRALYFNDNVAVGWVRGGNMEVAAEDPRQGVIFYEVVQRAGEPPAFERTQKCLQCHVSWDTFGVPGYTVLSTGPNDAAGYATGGASNDTTPFPMRWGGWYVTGKTGPMDHMGNVPISTPPAARPAHPPQLLSLRGQFDLAGYPTPYSDVVALMTLEHQSRMVNYLTWIGWQARVDAEQAKANGLLTPPGAASGIPADLRPIADDLVDYMLFVDEAPLPGPVEGTSGFTQYFSALGPADAQGRSLRQFDLHHWLMRYPCSYMIYAPIFDALPATAKAAIYERLWNVLSGQVHDPRYAARLTLANRRAVVEILRATKKGLPSYFGLVTH